MSAAPTSKSPAVPEAEKHYQGFEPDDELDLVDLLKPLWRHKFLIIGITLLAVMTALVYVFTTTPKYRIFTNLKPGIYRWNTTNKPITMKTTDLKNLMIDGIFDIYFNKLGRRNHVPKIQAAINRKGEQVTASFFWPDPEEGKKIMTGFIAFLGDEGKVEKAGYGVSGQGKDQTIPATSTMGRQRRAEQAHADLPDHDQAAADNAGFLRAQIEIAKGTLAEYEQQYRNLGKNTAEIISLRNKLLQAPQKDTVQLLLLGSTIQENIASLGTINEQIKTTRMEVATLQEMIARISLIEVIAPPESSARPEKPKKKKIVALAGVVGLFLAIVAAYFRHFWILHREELTAGP